MSTIAPALLGFLAGIVPSVLRYVRDRQRDPVALTIQKEEAAISGAKAASEAWAEYAKEMRDRVDSLQSGLAEAQKALSDCQQRWERLVYPPRSRSPYPDDRPRDQGGSGS